MTRAEFYAKQETAWRRHEKQRQEFASWYAYLCYKILRSRGYDHTPALEATFRRHPRAEEHFYGRLCQSAKSCENFTGRSGVKKSDQEFRPARGINANTAAGPTTSSESSADVAI